MTSRTRPDRGRLTVETQADGRATRIILRGEADTTNLVDLESALTQVEPNDAQVIQLDVSELFFVDVAALRHLTLFARQVKETGRDIRTLDPQPLLERLIRLVGVDHDLGLA